MTTQHTPTPWTAENTKYADEWVIDLPDGGQIILRGNAEANAAFIVRACNAHEELLAALKGLVELTEGYFTYMDDTSEEALDVAKAAIAKEEGK